MRKVTTYFILILLILSFPKVYSQNQKASDDPAQFQAQFKKLMDGSRNPQYIRAAAQLDSVWNSGMNAAQQQKFITAVKTQLAKGQKAGPIMYLFARNTAVLTKSPSAGALDGFLDLAAQAGVKTDVKAYQKMLETVRTISETGKLYSSNYNSLYLLDGSFSYKWDTTSADQAKAVAKETAVNDSWDTPVDSNYIIAPKSIPFPAISGAMLQLQNATFAMVTATDSVVFGPTNGNLSLGDGIFIGEKGKFTWESVGHPDIYADLDKYFFNISQPKLLAENVTIHADSKLIASIKGTLEYRGLKRGKNQAPVYPRFVSNGTDAQIKFSSPNIQYKGGFSLIGQEMYSTSLSGNPSVVSVSFEQKPAFKAVSTKFRLADSVVSAPLAFYSMPLGTDSLYHPGVRFKYNDLEGKLRLDRADKTDFAPLPYKDTYHKMDIWSQAMRWDFPKKKVEFYRIDGKQVVPVALESFDYFKKERFRGIAKEFGFQPLLLAANYLQTEKKSAFLTEELATKYKQNPKILRRTLERLTLEGYFIYDKSTDQFGLSKKGILYVNANVDKADYDNFQIASQYTANDEIANATIYLPDTLLTVLGVSRFIISDSLKIFATPSDKKVVIGRNRNFTINGQLVASNYQFRGQNLKFDYNQFFVNVAPSDSITFTPRDKYVKGQGGEVGGHVKYENGGTFYLSDPKNKSGAQKGKKSPRLVVPDGMTVYFDQPEREPNLYPREVFFKIPKIDMDGLDQRDVIFEGKFFSNGIVPDIATILKSMPDNSLGFNYKTPAVDMKIYDGKALARFTDTLTMDNTGLHSSAILRYMSATITAKQVMLGADSLYASGAVASIKEASIGAGYFPAVELKDYALNWFPQKDSMQINTTGKSFSFYKGTTNLEGSILLRSSGLYGNGVLKRSDSEISSTDIKFNKEGFLANRSQFSINASAANAGKKLLTGNNVNIDFNFKNGIANFLTDESGFGNDSSGMQIPLASYKTLIGSAKWDMVKKTILMKGFGETSSYTSTLEEQEGLSFDGSEAMYDIEKVTLVVKGVPYIQTADVKIIPDKGLVSIDAKGRINPLKNARIEIDTLNVTHRMKDADIKINSRNLFEGSATYQYITARKDTFNIKMQNFELREPESAVASRKSKPDNSNTTKIKYYTTARADIKETENLYLSPRIQFKGGINLVSYEPSLQLDGFVKPTIKFRKDFQSSWIPYKESPGETVAIKVDQNLKNEHEIPLSVGLHYNEVKGLYMTFLSPKESDGDEDIYQAKGNLNYDEDKKAFKVLPPPGPDGLIDEASSLQFDDKTGLANFAGPLKLVGSEWLQSTGTVEAQVDSSRFSFNTLLILKMASLEPLLQPLAAKIVEVNLEEQNSTAADDDAEQINGKLSALIGSKAVDAYVKLSAAGYKPLFDASPMLDAPIVLSNVNLHWSAAHGAYYSQGPIGVANFGKNNINAQMEGVMEIRKGVDGDEFSLFLQASPDIWYYFDFRQDELGVISSQIEFNDQIMTKSNSGKSKMTLVSLGMEEKDLFVNRFDDFYQPAMKKAKLVKAAAKKKTPTAAAKKKKEDQADGF